MEGGAREARGYSMGGLEGATVCIRVVKLFKFCGQISGFLQEVAHADPESAAG